MTETINKRDKTVVVWNRSSSRYRSEVPEPASPWTSRNQLGVYPERASYFSAHTWNLSPVTTTNWDIEWFEPSLQSSACDHTAYRFLHQPVRGGTGSSWFCFKNRHPEGSNRTGFEAWLIGNTELAWSVVIVASHVHCFTLMLNLH